ncbi:DUF3617 domain-containing protein [Edaphobacter aggregans]|uniref:DUF3617 domain-containing protein n=1 Tax=Edaphobacter aggregans TaxID=570835 RepID=UPI00055440C7|nr:DUF3617 family protein [Edaphobacter aggregans]
MAVKRWCASFAMTAVMMAPCVAQAPSAPPVKMGLWSGTTVTKLTGLQLPPEVLEKLKAMGKPVPGSEPRTIETESCLTAEKWKEMFTKLQQDREGCKVENLKQDSSSMSADMVCDSVRGGTGKGHVQVNFLSTEKVHGTMHMEMMAQSQPQPIVVDVTFDNTYQGADCKGISPDTPKMIMK